MTRGERIGGRFELKAEVAKGGMGTVYSAHDHVSGQQVAVKVLRSAEIGSTERFKRESALISVLDHPGIVKYVAHGIEPNGLHYLAMEWVEGETLLARMEGVGLTAAETMNMAHRIAEALGEAHKRGVVHRDIKPSNLMFQDGDLNKIKVVDFGIARRTSEVKGLTQTGVMVGTMGYMSPEQARATRSVTLDARSDVFALGCVLYECLTANTPFNGDNLMAVRAKILLVEPMPVRAFVPELPEVLELLLGRMMAKDPGDRPANGSDLAAEIKALGTIPATPRKSFGAPVAAKAAGPTVIDERPTEEVACVVLVSPYVDDDSDEDPGAAKDPALLEEHSRQVAHIVEPFGGQMHMLADGSVIVTVVGNGTVTERVQRAARCALAVQANVQAGQIVLTTEPDPAMTHVLDLLIDRSVRVLDRATINSSFEALKIGDGSSEAKIWLDDASAKLLGKTFEIRVNGGGHELVGER